MPAEPEKPPTTTDPGGALVAAADPSASAGVRFSLGVFFGPLEFLLELVRRGEIDLVNVPLTNVAEQYLAYLERRIEEERELDLDLSAEFLVQASTLLDWKSSLLLERGARLPDDEDAAHSLGLFRHLIEHHRFAFLALTLQKLADRRARRWGRPIGLIPREEAEDVYLDDVDAGDLYRSFVTVARETEISFATIRYDDRPIVEHMEELRGLLKLGEPLRFREAVNARGVPDRGRVVGTFLAVLELVRLNECTVKQHRSGDILISLPSISATDDDVDDDASESN